MSFRLYIVPKVGSGAFHDAFRPKYFSSQDGFFAVAPAFQSVDYGFEPWMIVGADLPFSDDTAVVAQPDCFALPFDLSVNLTTAQVTNVKNKLEAINVPAGWVTTGLTWIEVVRSVLGIFSFMQRLTAMLAAPLFTGGVTLATTISQLPQAIVTALQDAATSFGLSTAGVTGATTLRAVLKSLADQFGDKPYAFGTVTL